MTSGEFLTAHVVWNEVGGHGARFMVEQFRQHGLEAERLAKFEKRGSGYRLAVPALPEHYHRLKAGDTVAVDAVALADYNAASSRKQPVRFGQFHPVGLAVEGTPVSVVVNTDDRPEPESDQQTGAPGQPQEEGAPA